MQTCCRGCRRVRMTFYGKHNVLIYSPKPLVSFLYFEHAAKKEITQNQTQCLHHSTVASHQIRNFLSFATVEFMIKTHRLIMFLCHLFLLGGVEFSINSSEDEKSVCRITMYKIFYTGNSL